MRCVCPVIRNVVGPRAAFPPPATEGISLDPIATVAFGCRAIHGRGTRVRGGSA